MNTLKYKQIERIDMMEKLVVVYVFADDEVGILKYTKIIELATKADMEVDIFIECFGEILGADSYIICDESCLKD